MEVDNPLNLRNLSRTRWTARGESIKSVWNSYEAILDSLSNLERSDDGSTASGLRTKLLRFNFIVTIMFMKNIMYKSKRMTETLQSQDLNVIDTITTVETTVKSLEIAKNDIDGMNAEIKAAASFDEKLGIDIDSDFRGHHRQRRAPRRTDDNPDTAANLDVESFYRKEFKAILDTQISTFTDVLENCVATIKPLFDALQPGKEPPSLQTYEALANFHPENGRPDPNALMSEVESFTLHTKADVKDIFGAAKKAEEMRNLNTPCK